jgi:Kdo2-lipid IVA lauroyltransferase/acyltransferase
LQIRYVLEMIAYHVGARLVRALPQRVSYGLASRLGRWIFDRQGRHARWARANLAIAFPNLSQAERDEIGRRSFENFAWNIVDYPRSEGWTDEQILARFEVIGLEHVEKAVDKGNGVLLLTLHIGSWELGVQAIALALKRWKPAVLGRPMQNPLLYRRITNTRTRAGAQLIDRRDAAKPMLRALRDGRPIGLLLDQYSRRSRGVFVPLFGVRCSTSAGLATLALRTGAAIVPCYVLRRDHDHHSAIFLPELDFERSGDRKADIEGLTALCNRLIEKLVRETPEQWMWQHRRFRHSPDLPSEPY